VFLSGKGLNVKVITSLHSLSWIIVEMVLLGYEITCFAKQNNVVLQTKYRRW
jgi:hypothetical protein